MFDRVFGGEGFFAIWGLLQPFSAAFACCLVVSQNEDAAVFDSISVDTVVGSAIMPDSAIVGYFADSFAYSCTRVVSNLRP